MNLRNLYEVVKQMRDAQKKFFHTPVADTARGAILREARHFEERVDEAMGRVAKEQGWE